ncbi:hypothetical protein V6N13_142000 [Hibiscus sabdariffa]
MEQDILRQRYRRDRRKLLEFLLSSGLINEVRSPSGSTPLSDADFDKFSADYILHCIKYGGIVDVSEASKMYYAEFSHPIMIHSRIGNSYFLTSNLDIAGSPPRRVPPSTIVGNSNHASSSSSKLDSFKMKSVEIYGEDYGLKHKAEVAARRAPLRDSGIPSLGLPALKTGLSDDDLRESASELLLASVFSSGYFLSFSACLYEYESVLLPSLSHVSFVIKVKMFSIEDRKKEKNSKFLSRLKSKREKPHSEPQPSERHAELIDNIRAQMQISEAINACIRRNMVQLAARRTCGQVDLLQISLELLIGIFRSDFPNEKSYIQWKSRQELDVAMSPAQRIEIISSIRQVASKALFQQGKFGLQDETYYWHDAYHLNIRLYEKLLNGVFDILDEGQLIEFVHTDELCTWCDNKLQDYHLHFGEKPVDFRQVMALASAIGMLTSDNYAEIKLTVNTSGQKFRNYVERSVEAAIGRVANTILESKEKIHPLAQLAKQLRLVAQRELNIFFPIFRQWSPESILISVQKLHQFYGERLITFLKGVLSLSEDAKSVLPAAYTLDHELGRLCTYDLEEQKVKHSLRPYLGHYQKREVLQRREGVDSSVIFQ